VIENRDQPRNPIGYVSRRTGLAPEIIRSWERRFGVVEPQRDSNRRRLYSDEDVRRLTLLKRGVDTGRSISDLADLEPDALEALLAPDEAIRDSSTGSSPDASSDPEPRAARDSIDALDPVDRCLERIEALDGDGLRDTLDRAALSRSATQILTEVVTPVMHRVGEAWSDGRLRPANEHLATEVLRAFLANLPGSYRASPRDPRMVVATPPGQHHDIAALMVASFARMAGFHVTYLGASLPAIEIAAARETLTAGSIALSLTHPSNDPAIPGELRTLRRLVGDETIILVGGQAAPAYDEGLREIDAVRMPRLEHVQEILERTRRAPR